MAILRIGCLFLAIVAINSCNQTPRREQPNAREAGRDAYRASQKLKREAKDAAHELHNAEEQFREGWNEASREDNTRKDKPSPLQTPRRPKHTNQ